MAIESKKKKKKKGQLCRAKTGESGEHRCGASTSDLMQTPEDLSLVKPEPINNDCWHAWSPQTNIPKTLGLSFETEGTPVSGGRHASFFTLTSTAEADW